MTEKERMTWFIVLHWRRMLKNKGGKIILVILKARRLNGHKGIHRINQSKIKINTSIKSEGIPGITEQEHIISFSSIMK